jgi:hypothetical protein
MWRRTTRLLFGASLVAVPTACKHEESAPKPSAPVEDAAPPKRKASHGPETLVLAPIRAAEVRIPEMPPLPVDELRAHAIERMTASPLFAPSAEKATPGRRLRKGDADIRLSHNLIEDEEGRALLVSVEIDVQLFESPGERAPEVRHFARHALEEAGPLQPEQIVAIVSSDLDLAIDELAQRESMRQASDQELLERLHGLIRDPGLLVLGLRLAGDRQLADALPVADNALHSDDAEVRAAAFSALVAIANPDAVDALTRDVDFSDHETLAQIIEAVSAIGGADAEAFLEFVATGHPDDAIRGKARSHLGRLRARHE